MMDNPSHREYLTNLYEEYKDKMFFYAYNILKDSNLAEDAVNNAFIGLIRNVEKIMSLKRYDILRKNQKQDSEFLTNHIDDGMFQNAASDNPVYTADFEYIHDAMRRLPEQYQRIILLRFFCDYDYKTIAKELNISQNYVGVLLTRAKNALKKEILASRKVGERIG